MCNWYQYSIQFFTLAIYMMTLTSYCKKVTNMQGHIFATFIVMQHNQILFLHLIYSSNVFEFICAIKFYFFFSKLKNCNYIICRYDASNNWSAWCWRLHILPRPLDKITAYYLLFSNLFFWRQYYAKNNRYVFFLLITCIFISHMHLRIYMFTYCTVLSFYVLS